ncbi:rhamnogalacturonan lyase family protein [Sedimentisphaera salicampi]|uniref:rhamnogalacturonan lyase family protein n=1 Tax=Sedimentisphaera salicampi TaxID=1941349 RepID=UPI000B9D4E53|nr:LamG-like jellyroll fold domain-containing protein [Sedimentisphaera salicampi]OXU16011.1 Rhamnogalacturonan endolyase YesW precursor [Sedimentisphaera salicampi]
MKISVIKFYLCFLALSSACAYGIGEFVQDKGSEGIISLEAESFTSKAPKSSHSWNLINSPDCSGNEAMQAQPDDGTSINTGYAATSPSMEFDVYFVKTGTHYVWFRCLPLDGYSDSFHIGLDGEELASADRARSSNFESWNWSNSTMDGTDASFEVDSTGLHTVNVWMREDGFRVDKILLTTSPSFTPSGIGPDESIRNYAPSAPEGLSASGINNAVSLVWDENPETDIAGYTVKRSLEPEGAFEIAASDVKASSYIDNEAENGTTYYYVVSAVDTAGNESADSETVFAAPHVTKRKMEKLDRGTVAVDIDSGVYVGWRMLGTEPQEVEYNVYRGSEKINSSPISNSTNFIDTSGTQSSTYRIAAVIDGEEKEKSSPVSVWNNFYKDVPLERPSGGTTLDGFDYSYSPNDASVGDLDGDGEYEIVLKWDPSNSKDNSHSGYTGNVYIDAYEMDGTFLWRVDLGKNIRAGAHYTQFIVYDLNSDGMAEMICRTADGAKDGQGNVIGDPNADYRNSDGRILSGSEYLTVFDGQTGAALAIENFEPARGNVSDWGDSYGNRVDRFLAGVAYLDGERPSVIMTRGYYEKTVLAAWDWRGGQLTLRWIFDSDDPGNSAYAGQGCHSLSIADVDQDSRDEIIFGSCTIDDDGTGLYSTRLGHGDALHVADMDPSRPGLEVWECHETSASGATYRDAGTGEIIWEHENTGDVGRALASNIDNREIGYQLWSFAAGGTYNVDGSQISNSMPSLNFAIWWTGDLQREMLHAADGQGMNPVMEKWNSGDDYPYRLMNIYDIPDSYSTNANNYTKANPCLTADILGDWREEMIYRSSDNTKLRIFTTTYKTSHRIYTLMHDSQYRSAVAWQNVGYNQPPHPSFYIGLGMTPPPQPDISVVTPEVKPDELVAAHWNFDGGTPGAAMNDTGQTGQPSVPDLSGNGYDLYAWNDTYGPAFSQEGQTPSGLGLSCRLSGGQDAYTTNPGINSWSPEEWTIECAVKLDTLEGWQTFIGRDGSSQGEAESDFYLQKNGIDNKFRLNFDTAGGQRYILDSDFPAQAGQWYYLAAVSDGSTLKMYADALDGSGSQLAGTLSMSPENDNSLASAGQNWTIGRGWFDGSQVDHLTGFIDDVRFSSRALEPSEFLHYQCGAWGYIDSDLNEDCFVNLEDYSFFSQDWGYSLQQIVSFCSEWLENSNPYSELIAE